MTGYSTARIEEGSFELSVSIKGTNHRYLDVQVRIGGGADFIEPHIRRLLKEHVQRGHLEVAVSVESRSEGLLKLNRSLLDAYLKTCQALRQEFGLSAEPDLVALLRIPGIVNGAAEPGDAVREEIVALAGRAVSEAISRFNEMREIEGKALVQDLRSRLERLAELGDTVGQNSAGITSAFRKRLEKRVREIAKASSLDAARLAQEVTMLAIRSDITEELTRFNSHVDQAKQLLKEGREVGKRLDFLMQEMNREANTMLSKTTDVPDVGAKIAGASIEMKVEVEKLREQVQNIE